MAYGLDFQYFQSVQSSGGQHKVSGRTGHSLSPSTLTLLHPSNSRVSKKLVFSSMHFTKHVAVLVFIVFSCLVFCTQFPITCPKVHHPLVRFRTCNPHPLKIISNSGNDDLPRSMLRRDPNSGIHIQSSQHCKYGRQTRMIEKARMWNNGLCYGSSGAARAARLLHFAGIHKLAKRCVRDKRTVRGYRKAKQL